MGRVDGSFTRHLLDRYGKNEVESWYFEVWNEPNIDFWDGVPKQQTYFALYDVTARALKRWTSGCGWVARPRRKPPG